MVQLCMLSMLLHFKSSYGALPRSVGLHLLLLQQCNWLSIRQLIFYHTVLHVWRVKSSELPIHGKLQSAFTRSAVEGTLRVPQFERSVSGKSFMVRAALMWNTIPPSLRAMKQTFKKNLKHWIKQNIEID